MQRSDACELPNIFVPTLEPWSRRAHWLAQGRKHGLELHIQKAVGPAALPEHVSRTLLRRLEARLSPLALQQARKMLGIWATHHRFLAVNRNSTALLLEDDAILTDSFCESTRHALRALPADWDMLFVGHCAESVPGIRNCTRLADSLWLSRGAYPMCTHVRLSVSSNPTRAWP